MISCLILSAALHVGALYYFYGAPRQKETLSEALSLSVQEALEQEELPFTAAFTPQIELCKTEKPQPELLILPKLPEPQPKQQESGLFMPLFNVEIASPPLSVEPKEEREFFFEYQSEKHASLDLEPLLRTAGLPPEVIEPGEKEEIGQARLLPTKIDQDLSLPLAFISLKKLSTPPPKADPLPFAQISENTTPKLITPSAVDYLREQWISRPLGNHTPPTLEHYGIPELTDELQWNKEIEAKISYIQDSEKNRYLFSLSLEPGSELSEGAFPQHFYFLIDCSHSTEMQKIVRFKRALQRALAALEEKDTFNIICFGKKVSQLSEKNLPVTPMTLQKAQRFLEEGGAVSGDKNNFFGAFLPTKVSNDEVHSVILISDGLSSLVDNKQRSFFFDWLKTTSGNINIYTAACGQSNNLTTLDFLSYSTGGKLLYSDTNAGFPRKLVRLIKELHSPMIRDVTVDLVPDDSKARVSLCSGKAALGPMFSSHPYTLVGSIDELCDFTLLIQARNRKEEIYIKKNDLSQRRDARGPRTGQALYKQRAEPPIRQVHGNGQSSLPRPGKEYWRLC